MSTTYRALLAPTGSAPSKTVPNSGRPHATFGCEKAAMKASPLCRVTAYAEYASSNERRAFATHDGARGAAQTFLKCQWANRHSICTCIVKLYLKRSDLPGQTPGILP